jgi:hypothetical protein
LNISNSLPVLGPADCLDLTFIFSLYDAGDGWAMVCSPRAQMLEAWISVVWC